jgi:hypothetical protein
MLKTFFTSREFLWPLIGVGVGLLYNRLGALTGST